MQVQDFLISSGDIGPIKVLEMNGCARVFVDFANYVCKHVNKAHVFVSIVCMYTRSSTIGGELRPDGFALRHRTAAAS